MTVNGVGHERAVGAGGHTRDVIALSEDVFASRMELDAPLARFFCRQDAEDAKISAKEKDPNFSCSALALRLRRLGG